MEAGAENLEPAAAIAAAAEACAAASARLFIVARLMSWGAGWRRGSLVSRRWESKRIDASANDVRARRGRGLSRRMRVSHQRCAIMPMQGYEVRERKTVGVWRM